MQKRITDTATRIKSLIMQCFTAILFIHGSSYYSHRMHLTDRLFWNSSTSVLECNDSATHFETECRYQTIQELAYGTHRRLVTLPFEAPACLHLDLHATALHSSEIPVTLTIPARGWSWRRDDGERAWLQLNACKTALPSLTDRRR